MSTLITKAPSGLLDLVGTKTQGENPNQFSSTANLMLDGLFPWCVNRMECIIAPAAVVPAGPPPADVTHNVPDGEVWIIFGYSVLISTAAGEALGTVRPVVWSPDRGGIRQVINSGPIPTLSLAASQFLFLPMGLTQPFWLPSGYGLGFCGVTMTGAPVAVATAWITRLSA